MQVSGKLMLMALVMTAGEAWAQCTKDTDCKGERVCVQGACQDPTPRGPVTDPSAPPLPPTAPAVNAAPAPYSPPAYAPVYTPGPVAPPPLRRGWAQGAGIYGLVATGLVASFGIASAVTDTTGSFIVPVSLGSAATAVFLVSVPIVAAGGGSERTAQTPGLLGLRIGAWVAYGIAGALAVATVTVAWLGDHVDPGYIVALTTLGVASTVLMSVDALVTHGQLQQALEPRAEAPVRLAPSLTVLRTAAGGSTPAVGVVGAF